MMTEKPARSQLIVSRTNDAGESGIRYNFHRGQRRAWHSKKRIILVLAGVRSGKTTFGPIWLYREMQRCGPGDYLVAAPTYPLIDKAAGPEIKHIFGRIFQIGTMRTAPWQFTISDEAAKEMWDDESGRPSRIIMGHADDPESLAAMTGKAAWLDEAGQKRFKQESFEEVQRRLSIDEGRLLLTTTVYNLGWLKSLIYDPWIASGKNHPYIDVVQFTSLMNPAFPREEWDRAKATLPTWKFNMMFRGEFSRPAGLIYDCFEEAMQKVQPFPIPATWRRYLGLDFGGVNTAGVFFAEDPATKHWYAYREYHAGQRTAREHVQALRAGEPPNLTTFGGAGSEDNWRREFTAAGLYVGEPDVKEVEVGIDRVYGAIKRGELFVFSTLTGLLDELATYSRELDDRGEPTERIEDKDTYHHLDACRYIVSSVKKQAGQGEIETSGNKLEEFGIEQPGSRVRNAMNTPFVDSVDYEDRPWYEKL